MVCLLTANLANRRRGGALQGMLHGHTHSALPRRAPSLSALRLTPCTVCGAAMMLPEPRLMTGSWLADRPHGAQGKVPLNWTVSLHPCKSRARSIWCWERLTGCSKRAVVGLSRNPRCGVYGPPPHAVAHRRNHSQGGHGRQLHAVAHRAKAEPQPGRA